ncbi:MAG: hypothetical protein ABW148_05110 [Sedimenticola sp.]
MQNARKMTASERISFYKEQLARHTPPKSQHETRMLKVYQSLLASMEGLETDKSAG